MCTVFLNCTSLHNEWTFDKISSGRVAMELSSQESILVKSTAYLWHYHSFCQWYTPLGGISSCDTSLVISQTFHPTKLAFFNANLILFFELSNTANIFFLLMITDIRTKVTSLDNDKLKTGKLRDILNELNAIMYLDATLHY